jgi:hypothetical protein
VTSSAFLCSKTFMENLFVESAPPVTIVTSSASFHQTTWAGKECIEPKDKI